MGVSAILPWVSFPLSTAITGVQTVSGLVVSSTSALLSQLQAFLVSTLAWTLIDTGVSGLAENFVVRSSGASGDRQICLKFGASTADQTPLSYFACVSFASATDIASNATTDRTLSTNGVSALGIWMTGNKDFLCLITSVSGTLASNFLYAGLIHEFVSTVTQTPNQTIVVQSSDFGNAPATARMVETPTGTFNVTLNPHTFGQPGTPTQILGRSDPDLEVGVMYLWPLAVAAGATDRIFGILKNVLAVGDGADMVHGNILVTSAGSRYLVVRGTANPGLAVRLGDQ